jgi:signal transduction histidine kinase
MALMRETLRRFMPRSLRWQFILAVAGLELLILAGGATAIYALHANTESTRLLVEERMVRMQDAQDLVRHTLFIERESYQLASIESAEAMQVSYKEIDRQLAGLDLLVDKIAASGDNVDISVLDLHQASQLFRNTANIVAQLRENKLQAATKKGSIAKREVMQPQQGIDGKVAQQLRSELRRQASNMVASAQAQSDHFTQDFLGALQELAQTSAKNQRWVTLLLSGSLLLAWLVAQGFLGKHVLDRLQTVSQGLRQRDFGDGPPMVPVQGDDEIGEMARAVELFQNDRKQLVQRTAQLETERALQEELIRKLAEAHSQLLQSEKMASIGQLAAGVAHEINNPVGFVNSNLGTLKRYIDDLLKTISAYEENEGEMSEKTRAVLDELKKQIDLVYLREDVGNLLSESMDGLQRVKHIVQNLKDFSHVGEQKKQLANLEQGLDSTLNVVWNELKYKADIVKEYGGIPEIECIPSQLNQVFMNLLMNAVQAIIEHGKITIRTGQEGDNVWVEIEDTGSGIKPEHLAHIFDPFFTTKPVGSGTGLGLSLSYGIVQKHGGKIEVKSEVGKGTVFRVVLPQHAIPLQASAEDKKTVG